MPHTLLSCTAFSLIAAMSVFLAFAAPARGETTLTLHPGPPGEKPSELCRVEINGREAFVHHALVMAEIDKRKDALWTHKHPAQGEQAGFVLFDFAGGPVEVKVKLAKRCKTASLHPVSAKVAAKVEGDTVSFTLDKPRKLTLRVNGKWTDAIHFLASAPEVDPPKPDDPNVVYFGPGVHRIGSTKIESGKTVYLAPGALVLGVLLPTDEMKYVPKFNLYRPTGGPVLHITDAENVHIRGRGILDSSNIPHIGKPSIVFQRCKNVSVEGIVIRDSSNWDVNFLECEDASATDVKIISARLNSDGINSVSSRHVRIRDCFVRNRDDTFAVKAKNPEKPSEDIVVENCVVWNDWGYALGVTYETRADIRDVTYRDIDILHTGHQALGVHVVDSGTIGNILFKDIRIEQASHDILRADIRSDMWATDKKLGHIRGVTLDHVTYVGPNPPGSIIAGFDAEHRVEDVTIRGLTVNGKPVLKPEDAGFKINEHTANIRFEP
ncbi:MAG: glycosyl hydrolase family 28 protein [Planctomycetota bacterium]|nr:glycosyl hydrolase family 28 protein [Planctomycetota bacterium]